jgi:hypothetical protein
MGAEHPKDAPVQGGPAAEAKPPAGYETRDAHVGATFRAGIYLLGAIFLVAAIVIPLYRLLARQEAKDQPRRATVIETAPSPAAFPKLVMNEPQALSEFRAKEDALLDGYGWVEKDHGIARMPIAEALRIVGERGALPVFATAPATQEPSRRASAPPAGGPPGSGGTR